MWRIILLVLACDALQVSHDYVVVPYANLNMAGEWVDDFVAIAFSVHAGLTSAVARSVFEETVVDFGVITTTVCRHVYNSTLCITAS